MSAITQARRTIVARILEGDGRAPHAQRRAAFDNAGLAEPLRTLIDKVAKHAYKVTDDAITAAKASGLSKDEIGTARNLEHYGPGIERLTGLDPMQTQGIGAVDERIGRARFPVERTVLRADRELPFDAGRFDCVVTTWTLCSIPKPAIALAEMRRVLTGGRYLFIEHGRSSRPSTVRWQDRLNPIWCRLMDGCNINRPIDQLVEGAGFTLASLDRFQHKGPAVVAHMYRGVAVRS